MNAVTEFRGVPALQMDESELVTVLQASLFPGASLTSIKLVIGYCKAAGLDPMQKPVHIVPMWDGKTSSMRDVIMPGIGLYRTQAARSGELGGVSESTFGPDRTWTLSNVEVTAPEWCRITVKRVLANGFVGEFTATEYWIENYAVKGGKERSVAPNAMWTKRPRGQLAKCTQAQALRMAFPEMTGAAPTADEMEGRELDMGTAEESRNKYAHLDASVAKALELNEAGDEVGAFGELYEVVMGDDIEEKLYVNNQLGRKGEKGSTPGSRLRAMLKKRAQEERDMAQMEANKVPATIAEQA